MTDLPDEELIIWSLAHAGLRGYDMFPDGNPTLPSDLTVKVLDASVGTVEFIDTATPRSQIGSDSEGRLRHAALR